jgi:NOL1/NOP2/sun family putative RNA methylase
MKELPPDFLLSMQRLLQDEYPAFLKVYSSPAASGLRANTLKISPDDLAERLPYKLRSVPWCPAGFLLPDTLSSGQTPPGKHPYHAAGLYYLQEPSAMAVAELLDPQPGERVLDLCAAPGGKSTQLAARMAGSGLLVANETHPKRVWELAENMERWGARNLVVLNDSPARFAKQLPDFFDRVLVDAPCSGEGMFRKSESALRDWSPELVQSCAIRQSAILDDAARLTRPGGRLVYSTCTFNPQENEQTVAGFLLKHPDFELTPVKPLPSFDPGRPGWVKQGHSLPLERTVRLWPHISEGEGHYIAVLHRKLSDLYLKDAPSPSPSTRRTRHTALQWVEARKAFTAFCQNYLSPAAQSDFPEQQLALIGENLYFSPLERPSLQNLRAIRHGWWLGVLRSGERGSGYRFEPSHTLALGLKASDVRLRLDLEIHSAQVLAYLHGEVLDWTGEDGWVLVCIDGFPLGWGRGVQWRLKNHYPRGLRWD